MFSGLPFSAAPFSALGTVALALSAAVGSFSATGQAASMHLTRASATGGGGALRIIWGTGRSYPSNAADV